MKGKKIIGKILKAAEFSLFNFFLFFSGSKPKPLPILENAEPDVISKVFYFRDIFDFKSLAEATEKGCKHVVIIGGGFLGSELACSLTHYGCKVTQVLKNPVFNFH